MARIMSEKIIQYNSSYRVLVEEFLEKAKEEGSAGTYTQDKFNIDNLDEHSSLWIALVDNKVASISYAERSFITGTPESIRKCRYHILKKHRHGRYGFKMMKHQIAWAKENGFKHYYWTHDVNDKAINKLFQHKRTYIVGDNSWFEDEDYKKLTLETDLVFHDSPKSDMIQFVYSYYIDPNYKWEPIRAVIWHKHNGIIDNVAEVL
tara:strand:- start:239 stop:856 length:618 start_codon:yes stop_codon:yes gene_type:complete